MNDDDFLTFFEYQHLPQHLQEVSAPFHKLANHLVETIPKNAERDFALRNLLLAKDAAVRARLLERKKFVGDSSRPPQPPEK